MNEWNKPLLLWKTLNHGYVFSWDTCLFLKYYILILRSKYVTIVTDSFSEACLSIKRIHVNCKLKFWYNLL